VRDIDHYTRFQLHQIEVGLIAAQRDLLLSATVDEIENGLRQTPPGTDAKIGNGVVFAHSIFCQVACVEGTEVYRSFPILGSRQFILVAPNLQD
jgi:hypothetical protein